MGKKIILNENQLKFLIETYHNILIEENTGSQVLNELSGLIKKSNSFQKDYGNSFFEGDETKKIKPNIESYLGIDIDGVLDKFQNYLNTKNGVILNLILTDNQSQPLDSLIKEITQKFLGILKSEYDNINSIKKWGAKKLIKNKINKDVLYKQVKSDGESYVNSFLTQIFRRLANWISDELKSADKTTKGKYVRWCYQTAGKMNNVISNQFTVTAKTIINDLYS